MCIVSSGISQGCSHFYMRKLVILFKSASSFVTTIPMNKHKKSNKFQSCFRHVSNYLFFFSSYATCRNFFGDLWKYKDVSVFTTRIPFMLSIPFWNRSRMRSSPLFPEFSMVFLVLLVYYTPPIS